GYQEYASAWTDAYVVGLWPGAKFLQVNLVVPMFTEALISGGMTMASERRIRFCGEPPVNNTRRHGPVGINWLPTRKVRVGVLAPVAILAFCGTVFGHHGSAAWDTKSTV